MDRHELARRIAVSANALITISLFLVMIWWNASLVLFVGCWVMYCIAWWIEGSTVGPQATAHTGPFTVPRYDRPS